MEFTGGGLEIRFGPDKEDYLTVFPNVSVERLSDRDRLITIKGVYRLQGNSPETFTIERLV